MFQRASKFPDISWEVHCPGGGFGVTRLPIGVPSDLQGKKQKVEIGASVSYPDGVGTLLRFRNAGRVDVDANFRNSVGSALRVAGALVGHFVFYRPASVSWVLPKASAETVTPLAIQETRVIWQIDQQEFALPRESVV